MFSTEKCASGVNLLPFFKDLITNRASSLPGEDDRHLAVFYRATQFPVPKRGLAPPSADT